MFTLYIDCILALHLDKHFGLGHSWIGVFFLLSSVTYVIGAPLASYLSNFIHRRYIAFAAFALMIIENILEGPSVIFGLDDSIVYVLIGVTMLGLCLSMALVPLLSELITHLES
jgi:MFS family permease